MKRALLVVDVQNEHVTGRLPVRFPSARASLAHIGRAMYVARRTGVAVVVVAQVSPADAELFARGSYGAALHPTVSSKPRSHLVRKEHRSAFDGTDLDDWLQVHGIDTVTLTGYTTPDLVDSTGLDARRAGYVVEVLSDATGACGCAAVDGHDTALATHRGRGPVVTTEAWTAAVAVGAVLPAPQLTDARA